MACPMTLAAFNEQRGIPIPETNKEGWIVRIDDRKGDESILVWLPHSIFINATIPASPQTATDDP